MKKQVGIGVGLLLFVVIGVLVYFNFSKKKEITYKHTEKIIPKKQEEKPKPIPPKKVVEDSTKVLEDIDLSRNYVYADTAFGYAKTLEYAYGTKPVKKPMYEADREVIKNGVLVIKNLKPNTWYYLKIWINNNLYVDTKFKTQPRDYKKRQELERKIYKIKESWASLSYDASKEYIYKNYLLAFAKKVEYKIKNEKWKVKNEKWKMDDKWLVYTGESLKSGYIYLKGLKPNTTYKLEILLNWKKKLADTFTTASENVYTWNVVGPSYSNVMFRVENETGLVIKDGSVNLKFIWSGDLAKIDKIIVKKILSPKEIRQAEDKSGLYTEEELKQCNNLAKKIYKWEPAKNSEATIQPVVEMFPYIATWDIKLLTWDLQQYKDLFKKCASISVKLEKFRKQFWERVNKELEKQAKTYKIWKLIKSYTLNELTGSEYQIEIVYKDKEGKEWGWYGIVRWKIKDKR